MYRLIAILLLSVSLTNSATANSSETSTEESTQSEENIMETLFGVSVPGGCPTFPLCNMTEEQEMEIRAARDETNDSFNGENQQ